MCRVTSAPHSSTRGQDERLTQMLAAAPPRSRRGSAPRGPGPARRAVPGPAEVHNAVHTSNEMNASRRSLTWAEALLALRTWGESRGARGDGQSTGGEPRGLQLQGQLGALRWGGFDYSRRQGETGDWDQGPAFRDLANRAEGASPLPSPPRAASPPSSGPTPGTPCRHHLPPEALPETPGPPREAAWDVPTGRCSTLPSAP